MPFELYKFAAIRTLFESFIILKLEPNFVVSCEPFSKTKFIIGFNFKSLVMIFIIPPIASLPHKVDCELFKISILSIFEVK